MGQPENTKQQPARQMIALAFDPEVYEFVHGLFVRALQSGLIAPDELSISAVAWQQLQRVETFTPVAPPLHVEEDLNAESEQPAAS